VPPAAQYPENEEVLAALRVVLLEVRALCKEVAALRSSAPAAPTVAPDSDLDGQYGDEEVRKDPPRWKGAPTAPCRMSECSPDYLDELAEFFDFKAGRPRTGKEKYVAYDRKSAARARGWAARKRAQLANGDEL
jgi:hypothetical protein